MPLCDHVRPGSLHRVNRPTEAHAPILIKIIKGGVLEWLASAPTSYTSPEIRTPYRHASCHKRLPFHGPFEGLCHGGIEVGDEAFDPLLEMLL